MRLAPAVVLRWLGRGALYSAVAVAPLALAVYYLHQWIGHALAEYQPVETDEISYWHQSATFATAGSGNGYYTYQEELAPLPTYGPWGPAFPALYGTAIRLIGLGPSSIVTLNWAAFLSLIVVALFVARASVGRALLIGALLVTFTPLLVYLVSGMQEPFQCGLAVLMAAQFHRLIRAVADGDRPERARVVGWLIATIGFASLLRPTWAPLLIAVAVLASWGEPARLRWRRVSASVIVIGGFAILFKLWSSPYPYLRVNQAGGLGKLWAIFSNIEINLGLLVRIRGFYRPLHAIQHFEVLGVLAVAVVGLVIWWRRRRRGGEGPTGHGGLATPVVVTPLPLRLPSVVDGGRLVAATIAIAVGLPLLAILVLYDLDAGTRTISAHLLFAVVLLALAELRWARLVPVAVIAANLATWSLFHQDFMMFNSINYSADPLSVALLRSELAPHLRFRPGADPWCNTVLVADPDVFPYQVTAIPPGFGVSVDINHVFRHELRSAYILGSTDHIGALPHGGDGLELLATTSRGQLYRNPASPCYDGSS